MNMHAGLKLNDRITEDDAIEAAERFLACIFGDNSVLADCGLDADDFSQSLHRLIFKEAQRLYQTHQHINAVSMKPALPKTLEGLSISPAEYLTRLTMMGTDPTVRMRMEGDIPIIKGVALSRGLASEAEFAATIASEGHTLLTLDEEIEALEQRLKERRTRLAALKASVSAGDAYLAAFNASAKADGVIGVPIPLPEIAKVLSEPVFEAGNLYGLLSSSGEGKTSLTMQLMFHALRKGHPVLFLSYDQSAAQCVRQMIAQEKGIDLRQQRDPSNLMTPNEQDQCVKFALWLKQQPLEIIRCQREGVAQLVAYARRFIKSRANGKTPFIVIDHIKKIKVRDTRADAGTQSAEITVELKALADEVAAAVLLLNQRNSAGIKRDNPRPIDEDLYGGEGARQDYDSIVYLYRPQKYRSKRVATAANDRDWKIINKVFGEFGDEEEIRSKAEIGVIKNRFGDPEVRETLKFEARYTRYVSNRPAVAQERMI
jgi:replicative DNA helicase